MAYIGKEPIVGNFQKCDALTASGTADYTLQVSSTNVVPESANHMLVSLNGVIQQPGASGGFTVSGSTLSFTSALTSSDTIDFVILLGNVLDIGVCSDSTVTSAKLSGALVTPSTLKVTNSSDVATNGSNAMLQAHSTAGETGISSVRYSNNAYGTQLHLGHSRNGTPGSNTIVADNDILGYINFVADDGTDLRSTAAQIRGAVNGTPGANDMPGMLQFLTTADGSQDPTEHFRIASNGDLTATDTSIASNSDERVKENITNFTYDIEKFKLYQPKTFDWKNPSQHNGESNNRGLIAQEVQAIDPYWIDDLSIGEDTLDYNLIPADENGDHKSLTSKLGKKDAMYISVINQLITRIEALENA